MDYKYRDQVLNGNEYMKCFILDKTKKCLAIIARHFYRNS